jgi:predicted esterase
MQVSDLDSKLYKMEQRIELLEKKTGIDNSSNTSTGGFSW